MKMYLIILLTNVFLGCGAQNLIMKKEVYQFKWPNGNSDYILLEYYKDSVINGVYKGVYIGANNELFYYETDFLPKKTKSNYDLVFELNNFIVSKSPFDLQDSINHKFVPFNDVDFPMIFKYPMIFLGTYSNDKLYIVRTTALHVGSKSDSMVFDKSSQ